MRRVWLLCLLSQAALAQIFLSDEHKSKESPRSMFLEVKLSPYMPAIDDSFAQLEPDQRPYAYFFGVNNPMLLGEIEFEYQFFQAFGTLSAGASVGYAEKYGKAIDSVSRQRIGQSTGLSLMPIKAMLVYRFDWLKQKTKVPLVPYAKGAFVVMPWWVSSGSDVSQIDQFYGSGVRFGLAGVLGLALELDFIDQRLARDFDSSMGVNHTYLFAEATFQGMDFFPSIGSPLNLSSIHFMFGLGLEF